MPPTYDSMHESRLPKIAQTAGIVVSNPTTARVAPTAFRCSAVSRSEIRRATPAPSIARVAMMNASSGRLRWISFTIVQKSLSSRGRQTRNAASWHRNSDVRFLVPVGNSDVSCQFLAVKEAYLGTISPALSG